MAIDGIEIEKLLKNDLTRPDIVIFLDGLNDFGQPGANLRKEPFFTPVISSISGTFILI